jgi:hypothetical protein
MPWLFELSVHKDLTLVNMVDEWDVLYEQPWLFEPLVHIHLILDEHIQLEFAKIKYIIFLKFNLSKNLVV